MVQTNLDIGMSIELDESTRNDRDAKNQLNNAQRANSRKRKYFEPGGRTEGILTEDFTREQRFNHPLNAFVFNSALESGVKSVD